MKRCPHCRAVNSEKAAFCWRCYSQLYVNDDEGYLSLRRRIKEKVKGLILYRDIRDFLYEKAFLKEKNEE